MSSSFSSDLSNEIKQAFKKHSAKYAGKIGVILASVFKCFTSNQADLGNKVSKILEEVGEADQGNFNDFYNSILKLVTYAYRERFTADQLESELTEIGREEFSTGLIGRTGAAGHNRYCRKVQGVPGLHRERRRAGRCKSDRQVPADRLRLGVPRNHFRYGA